MSGMFRKKTIETVFYFAANRIDDLINAWMSVIKPIEMEIDDGN